MTRICTLKTWWLCSTFSARAYPLIKKIYITTPLLHKHCVAIYMSLCLLWQSINTIQKEHQQQLLSFQALPRRSVEADFKAQAFYLSILFNSLMFFLYLNLLNTFLYINSNIIKYRKIKDREFRFSSPKKKLVFKEGN